MRSLNWCKIRLVQGLDQIDVESKLIQGLEQIERDLNSMSVSIGVGLRLDWCNLQIRVVQELDYNALDSIDVGFSLD